MTADFFAQDLPAGTSLPTAASKPAKVSPAARLASLLQQAVEILSTEPREGHCHYAALEPWWLKPGAGPVQPGQQPSMKIRLVRGTSGKFLLSCKIPEIGDVAVGQGQFPWLLAGGKLFAGTKNPGQSRDPLCALTPQTVTKLRVARGLAGSIVMVPELLGQWLNIEDDPRFGATRTWLAARSRL